MSSVSLILSAIYRSGINRTENIKYFTKNPFLVTDCCWLSWWWLCFLIEMADSLRTNANGKSGISQILLSSLVADLVLVAEGTRKHHVRKHHYMAFSHPRIFAKWVKNSDSFKMYVPVYRKTCIFSLMLLSASLADYSTFTA